MKVKEVHIAPMTVGGEFHIGKVMEVVAADTFARWHLGSRSITPISLVHDSWNTYGQSQIVFKQRNTLIDSYQQSKDALRLLPSADLHINRENRLLQVGTRQEFRDDDPGNAAFINDALRQLKKRGFVIPGIVNGEPGLYLDIDELLRVIDVHEILDNVTIYPSRYTNAFSRTLDATNKSSYLGKIPITKSSANGLIVQEDLLSGDDYYIDPRFSPKKDEISHEDKKTCVSPLIILGLLPYIRRQKNTESNVDFMTNGVGSALRFNLLSILVNAAIDPDLPYNNLHLFGRMDLPGISDQELLTNKGNGLKTRFIVFDQLSSERKIVHEAFAHNDDESNIIVPEFDILKKKVSFLRDVLSSSPEQIVEISANEMRYLESIGVAQAMREMHFAKAFKIIKKEITARVKQINQGVSHNDQTLLKMVDIFLPGI